MLYNLAIGIYDLIVHIMAPFSRKPRKMMKGHWVVYELLRQQIEKDARYIWFHAASLGEFEQGRPLIEKIRAKYPDYKILLTFFSPSGYEVRKNYRGADVVCYLPFDKPRNVKKFLDISNPVMAFFIKYFFLSIIDGQGNILWIVHEEEVFPGLVNLVDTLGIFSRIIGPAVSLIKVLQRAIRLKTGMA